MDSMLKSKIEKALAITQRVTGSWAVWGNRRTDVERGGGPLRCSRGSWAIGEATCFVIPQVSKSCSSVSSWEEMYYLKASYPGDLIIRNNHTSVGLALNCHRPRVENSHKDQSWRSENQSGTYQEGQVTEDLAWPVQTKVMGLPTFWD